MAQWFNDVPNVAEGPSMRLKPDFERLTRREMKRHVHPPPTILVCVVHQVTDHLATFLIGKWYSNEMRSDDEPWNEENGSVVFSELVTIACSKVFGVLITISRRFERGFRWR